MKISILIIDDNPAIHLDFKKILSHQDDTITKLEQAEAALLGKPIEEEEYTFDIDSAYQGEEALTLIEQGIKNKKHYALAFIDIRMPPGMDGVETTRSIWELDPYVQVIICTAYTDYSWEDFSKKLHKNDQLLILKKPFENIEVLQLANSLSKKWLMAQGLRMQMKNLEELVSMRTKDLEKSISMIRATLEASTDGILVINNDLKVSDYNKKFLDMLHISPQVLEKSDAMTLEKIIIKKLKTSYEKEIITNTRIKEELDNSLEFTDGRIIEYYSIPQRINDNVIGRVFCFRDITEQKKLEEQLIQQATHDALTNLPNRIVLYDRLQNALTSAKRYKQMIAVLFLDLDHFKLINDSFGHDKGDEILKQFVLKIKKNIREMDTFVRYGGDEFIILLQEINVPTDIIRLCQKILKTATISMDIDKQEIIVTTSIGISIYPKDGITPDDLIKNADAANHFAKESGRNNFNFFTKELNVRANRRLILESNLWSALERKEFLIHYQPIISASTKEIIGVEALLRWQHPKLGLILPQEFIPIAEEVGLILPLGDWVLLTACSQIAAWQKQGLPPIHLAVNLASKQLMPINFIEKVSDILKQSQLSPHMLELELTESSIIEGTDHVMNQLQALKKMGIRLVIDDFGTGYSNLSYLNRLPIDKIKIDRSFISYISSEPKDVAVTLAIIGMAKSLNIRSVAEGVETKEQFDFLRNHHCDEIQGFYFYKPQPAEIIAKLLKNKPSSKN